MNEQQLQQLLDEAEARLLRIESTDDAARREAAYRLAMLELVQGLDAIRDQIRSSRLAALRNRIQRLLVDETASGVDGPAPEGEDAS